MISIALKEKKEVAENTLLYTFERPKDFLFLAGQYVSMKVTKKPFQDDRGDFRSFSIASPPYQKDILEFAMRRGESAFKKNLESLEVGESVEITPAVGKCIFGDPDAEKGIVFLVGGVGVTPARSMLLQANFEKRPEQFFLFDSNRRVEDAPFLDEFSALDNIDLTRIYTMSDQNLSKMPWSGELGRIDRKMIQKYVTMDWGKCTFYIVGIGVFVQAMRELLTTEGVAVEKILSDDFGGSVK
jgi:ferredoxin-NADP reductase